MRIAIIGGTEYVEEELEDFLYKLHAKYPDSIIVTGDAVGRKEKPSAEKATRTLMEALGHTVEVPPKNPQFAGIKSYSQSDHQVREIMGGILQLYKDERGVTRHRSLTPPADIIVTVGSETSNRAAMARKAWDKTAWYKYTPRTPYFNVATPKQEKAKPPPKRRAKKRREMLAA